MLSLKSEEITASTFAERLTLSRLLTIFFIGTVSSFAMNVFWMLLGFRYFTAKDSDVPWYYPIAEILGVVFLLSLGGLVVTGVAAIIRHFQDE